MAEHDEQFDTDRASGGTLPDGKYQGNEAAIVTEARIDHNDRDDTYTMIMKFEAEYPVQTQSGERLVRGSIRKWYNLDNEVGRSICAQDMARFGYDSKLSELQKACEDEFFIGHRVEIAVKTKPGDERDFVNVYVNKVLGKGVVPAPGAPTNAMGDDDIPF